MIVGKLGKLPRPIDAKFLSLEDYQCGILPTPPDAWDGSAPSYGLYGNDRLGDCVVASFANLLRQQAQLEGRSVTFTDDDVVGYYEALTGGADTGLVMLSFLDRVRLGGFPLSSTNKVAGFAAVDHGSTGAIKTAAWLLGGLHVGAALPIAAQHQTVWDVSHGTGDEAPGTWGGHAMTLAGYTSTGVILSTWGRIQPATWAWVRTYVDEAYAILDAGRQDEPMSDMIAWDDLISDLDHLGRPC